MDSLDDIINLLKEQGIDFELLQDKYMPSPDCPVNKVVNHWKSKFIANRTAPYLDHYLWHIFSFGGMEFLEKEAAVIELKRQHPSDTLIFNEPLQFLIKCNGRIPLIEIEDFFGDIYVSHHNMKWTYVVTHEADIGPFFSTGI